MAKSSAASPEELLAAYVAATSAIAEATAKLISSGMPPEQAGRMAVELYNDMVCGK